jgi:hypothetical protein
MWSVFSLLCTFLVVPRNYYLSTPQSGFQGIYKDGMFLPLLRNLQTQESSLHVCWCLCLDYINVLRLPSNFVSDCVLSS